MTVIRSKSLYGRVYDMLLLSFVYCIYPLLSILCLSVCLSLCLSVCKHDFCKKALSDFSDTLGFCDTIVWLCEFKIFPLILLVRVKFNKNQHFWPVHQIYVTHICKQIHMWKISEDRSFTDTWWICWPEKFWHQVTNVGRDMFGAGVSTNSYTYSLHHSNSRLMAPQAIHADKQ